MADQSYLKILQQGVEAWNYWRAWNPIKPSLIEASLSRADLSRANLSSAYLSGANLTEANLARADLSGADLSESRLRRANLRRANLHDANLHDARLTDADLTQANLGEKDLAWLSTWGDLDEEDDYLKAKQYRLWGYGKGSGANLSGAFLWGYGKGSGANLSGAHLIGANLARANLRGANLRRANLHDANLRGANLPEANLTRANLTKTDLSGADLSNANLRRSSLVEANLERATLEGCRVYGISAWSLKLKGAKQQNLNISDDGEPAVMVDNLEVAQFIYLLLNNEKIRDVINTIGEKGVLILGRFTEERKPVLDAIRDRLRELGFVPMMFDFERAKKLDFSETIKTLAGLSRFIIADITNPRSSPLELQATMPDYMVPFVPIIHEDEEPFAMFQDLQQKYGDWVLDVLEYDSAANLQEVLEKAVVKPASEKADQLIRKKTEAIRTRHINEYQ